MARTIIYIATKVSSGESGTHLALEDIPQDIRTEVEEAYAGMKANPYGRFRASFDTAEEMATYIAQVTAYCAQRPAGAIRFRKSPTRNLPDNTMDFRITDLKTEAEQKTEQVRTAIAGVPGMVAPPEVATATPAKRGRKATAAA